MAWWTWVLGVIVVLIIIILIIRKKKLKSENNYENKLNWQKLVDGCCRHR